MLKIPRFTDREIYILGQLTIEKIMDDDGEKEAERVINLHMTHCSSNRELKVRANNAWPDEKCSGSDKDGMCTCCAARLQIGEVTLTEFLAMNDRENLLTLRAAIMERDPSYIEPSTNH